MNNIQNVNIQWDGKHENVVSTPVNCIVNWGNQVVNIAALFSFVKSVLH